jgi:hypothetical protein
LFRERNRKREGGVWAFEVPFDREIIIMGSRNNNNVINRKDYILLKDFRMEIEVENEKDLSLSFWVYLIDSSTTTFPATIIKQVWKTVPFLCFFLLDCHAFRHSTGVLSLFLLPAFYPIT